MSFKKVMPLVDQITSSMSANDSVSELSQEPDNKPFKSSDDEHSDYGATMKKIRKRVRKFSDSESEEDKHITPGTRETTRNSSDSDDYTSLLKDRSKKLHIKNIHSDGSESDSQQTKTKENELYSGNEKELQNFIRKIGSDSEVPRKSSLATKNEEHQNRMKNKRNKIRDKFKELLNSRDKNAKPPIRINTEERLNENQSLSSNDDEETSIRIIRQKIKERASALKMSSIIDTDTSEDESKHTLQIKKPKKQQRRVKPTSPKPQRMSAKQAMENMQKIKSESNRMLREKDVSLPYHRPKALNLKDIMSRRKLAVSADGKALPIKMNEEQLKQYSLQLEQRQKEMMELCKSESEEEKEEDSTADGIHSKDTSNNVTDLSNKDCKTLAELNSNNCSETSATDYVDSEVSIAISISMSENTHVIIEESSTIGISKSDNWVSKECDEINKIRTDDENEHNQSEEMQLVYNDSIEDTTVDILIDSTDSKTEENINKESEIKEIDSAYTGIYPIVTVLEPNEDIMLNDNTVSKTENCTETDSQFISWQYDTEKDDFNAGQTDKDQIRTRNCTEKELLIDITDNRHKSFGEKEQMANLISSDGKDKELENDFPDDDDVDIDDINIEDIDNIIENAEIVKDEVLDRKFDSPAIIKDSFSLNKKPILMGAPGMVIDLDGGDATAPKKLTGVELLKERFTYFARLKTPEEMERERERRQKPGTQHIKLRQELEDKIAEQRSLEWAKRLEGEKQQQNEMAAVRGDTSDVEDDIDKIEAKLEEDVDKINSSESEDEIEDDVLLEDKPRKKNPLLEDEAEESDVDESEQDNNDDIGENDNDIVEANDAESEESSSSDEDESSESEDEKESKPKKGRILKAFEDSDDEETAKICNVKSDLNPDKSNKLQLADKEATSLIIDKDSESKTLILETPIVKDVLPEAIQKPSITDINKLDEKSISESQDDDLQLAQVPKAFSEELFTSLESVGNKSVKEKHSTNNDISSDDNDLGSQTFSILQSDSTQKKNFVLDSQEKFSVISDTQPYNNNLDAIVGMCSGSFSQNFIEFKPPSTQSQIVESQAIGEDLLDMCTGNFYDNKFVSQTDENVANTSAELSQDYTLDDQDQDQNAPDALDAPKVLDAPEVLETPDVPDVPDDEMNKVKQNQQGDILKSVLDELNDPEFESCKPMKYFNDNKSRNKENEQNVNNTQLKKKFVIDSDDEANEESVANDQKKKKRLKRRKPEKRALQISDDEDDEHSEEIDDSMSEADDVNNAENERLVEYDSEENEVEIKQPKLKKNRKMAAFFEQEAELTSEDEWAGSGDEDEAGLDTMEREAGDDETFHQGKLQRELGQIHIRDVLDQDKREVRLIQELLFEDGDLGVGGRQRKFRWRDAGADGEDPTGTSELADTQEEFESEEQWRKQRHEREMFLREMKTKDGTEDELNVSVNRSTIIKAKLCSRTMSSLLEEVNSKSDAGTTLPVLERKVVKDPSPTKPFSVYQQQYHGSLLTRGRGALERLAALATPLASADHAVRPTHSNTNFVFAAITQEDEPKVNKRKAETNVGTPQLVKKMRTEDKKKQLKSSLLDYMKA